MLVDNYGARRKKKCLGRGIASGKGKTCGKGHKGQKARSGVSLLGFEGGQMPLYIRMPKRGFNNYNRTHYTEVTFTQLANLVQNHNVDPNNINVPELAEKGLIKGKYNRFKLLNKGKLEKACKITVHAATSGALEVVKKAKGSVTLLTKTPAA
jgi:large subunit ribosomal protein L15